MLLASAAIQGVAGQAFPSSGNVFYFHFGTQLYRNENGSVTVLEEANLSLPLGSTPQVVEVAAAIRNATSIFFGTAWIGSVAWTSQPITEPATIRGPIDFTVWLSSDDSPPTFSGIGAGVAVLDQQDHVVGGYVYSYSFAQGKILTTTQTAYEFTVNFDRQITPSQKLVFAVGVGSTSVAWRMKVYFDSEQYASRAQLPSNITVIPEFTQTHVLLIAVIVFLLSLTKRWPVIYARRNGRQRSSAINADK
jgi:hypothetical protein